MYILYIGTYVNNENPPVTNTASTYIIDRAYWEKNTGYLWFSKRKLLIPKYVVLSVMSDFRVRAISSVFIRTYSLEDKML